MTVIEAIEEAKEAAAFSSRTGDWNRDFITEMAQRGYVIVPKEATQEMICAALDEHDRGNRSYSDVYRAMTGAHQ